MLSLLPPRAPEQPAPATPRMRPLLQTFQRKHAASSPPSAALLDRAACAYPSSPDFRSWRTQHLVPFPLRLIPTRLLSLDPRLLFPRIRFGFRLILMYH